MPFLSANLKKILEIDRGFDEELDLDELRERVAAAFGENAEAARALIGPVRGKVKRGTLALHLFEVMKTDSAVRDIHTTGHLAKFLSRLDVFRKTSDYRIVGMPNPLFDSLSQAERAKYFEGGASLELEADAFESPETQRMLERESEILARFGCA